MENPQVFIITLRKELFIPPQSSSFPKASPPAKEKKCSFMNLWYGGLGKISEPQSPLIQFSLDTEMLVLVDCCRCFLSNLESQSTLSSKVKTLKT